MESVAHHIPADTSFTLIDGLQSWSCLNEKESLYAYNFAKASWSGAKINFFHRSYESPALLYLILKAFEKNSAKEVEAMAKEHIPSAELERIFVYIAAFANYCGNFRPFENSKFVPECVEENFVKFFRLCPYWKEHAEEFERIYSQIGKEVFSHEKPYGVINFGDKEGTSGYQSRNVTAEDAEKVKEITTKHNLLSQNDRLIKVKENEFILRVASVEEKERVIEEDGVKLTITYGEFLKFMADVNRYLTEAQKYSANDTQKEMLRLYIEHFRTGDMQLHKEAQKQWLKDVKPVVEANIGFVETDLDPLKTRAQFQGFVSIANKEQTRVCRELLESSHKTLQHLPWGKQFEVDVADGSQPNSMDNLTFAFSTLSVEFDLPSYKDLRETYGKKTHFHNNSVPLTCENSLKQRPWSLPMEGDIKYHQSANVTFGSVHETIGHGSGKQLKSIPQCKNPLDGSEITSFYKQNEDFKSVFGEMADTLDEVKANGVGKYLSLFEDIQQIALPSYTKEERWKIVQILWYNILIAAIQNLKSYDFKSKKWQSWGCMVTWGCFGYMDEYGGVFEIKDTVKNGKPSFVVHMNLENIKTRGKEALAIFLKHLQVYKSTADVKGATAFLNKYSEVNIGNTQVPQKFIKYQKILIENEEPESLNVQSGLRLSNDKVEYLRFEPTVHGCIDAAVCHLAENCSDIIEEWEKNAQYFRY